MHSLLNNRWFLLVLRLGLGLLFIYAGTLKMLAPQPFADSIASFKLLPNTFVSLLALGLPPFELAVGCLLIIGPRKRAASCSVLLLSAIFIIALGQALVRGLEVDCGCFGSGPPSRLKTWLAFLRDVAVGAAAWLLFLREFKRNMPIEPSAPDSPQSDTGSIRNISK